jgi:hypothetical protein
MFPIGRIVKVAKLIADVCGGWWSAMSGAISIPFAFAALFFAKTPDQKTSFTALAFVALLACVFRTAWRSYQLKEQSQMQERDEHLPLKLDLVVKDNNPLSRTAILVVSNPSKHTSADDVEVKLLEIDPSPNVTTSNPTAWLDSKTEYLREPARVIHPQASSEYEAFVFESESMGTLVEIQVNLRSPSYGLSFRADWINESLPPLFKDYSFKFAVSARGRAEVT